MRVSIALAAAASLAFALPAFADGGLRAALTRKAESGDTRAFRALSALYLAGTGVTKDAAKALYWLTRAANNDGKHVENEEQAGVVSFDQWQLSTFYFEGKIVAKNDYLAAYWLKLALNNYLGDVGTESIALYDKMQDRQDMLNKRLPKAQRDKVDAAVAAWHATHDKKDDE